MLRITGGRWRGRRLKTPRGEALRPLRGRLREALFSIVSAYVPDARVLDLFSGTGAVGIEALSRGAAYAAFVEQNPAHARLIEQNLALAQPVSWRLYRGSVLSVLPTLPDRGEAPFDLIYIGAPYNQGLTEKTLSILAARPAVMASNALIVAETHSREELPDRMGGLVLARRRTYGVTTFWFFRPDAGASEQPDARQGWEPEGR
ncbi:MAG: 16S rRNA (guanine(966)-N(2))-methyltransferase RsmD [Candidatus Sumerlaeia bacterium]